jgi:hypothetical protein
VRVTIRLNVVPAVEKDWSEAGHLCVILIVVLNEAHDKFVLLQFIHLFIHQWFYSPLLGPGLLFSFIIYSYFTQTVGFLGRVISPF